MVDWRAPLFVPANRPDRFAKAATSRADAVILDLEDAVAAPEKDHARGLAAARPIAALLNVARLAFGSVDYCLDLGMEHQRDLYCPSCRNWFWPRLLPGSTLRWTG